MCAILLSLGVVSVRAQSSARFHDLAPELAEKIAAAVMPITNVNLAATAPATPGDQPAMQRVRDELARLLTARGVHLVDPNDAIPSVRFSCFENLRERACLAEIRKGEAREVVSVARPHDPSSRANDSMPLALELRPVYAQRTPILDVAMIGQGLLVLDRNAVSLHQQAADTSWHLTESRQLSTTRVWPRDLRGRLRVAGDGFDAFLPGVTCRGKLNPLNLVCGDDSEGWPIGIENTGIDPSRNYFTTPEGLPFYGAAALGPNRDARWLVIDRRGALTLLDGGRRPIATIGSADDVVALQTPCGADTFVVAASRASKGDTRDALRLLHVAGREVVPATAPAVLPGTLTALWAAPGSTAATSVVHDPVSGRYEALQVSIACAR